MNHISINRVHKKMRIESKAFDSKFDILTGFNPIKRLKKKLATKKEYKSFSIIK